MPRVMSGAVMMAITDEIGGRIADFEPALAGEAEKRRVIDDEIDQAVDSEIDFAAKIACRHDFDQ